MSAAEVGVVVARVASVPLNVYDAQPTSTAAYPYVVVYADAGIRSSDRDADVRVTRTVGWQTTVVASSAKQCRLALDALTGALEDWRPSLAGRQFSKVEHTGSQPVRKDDELPDRVLFVATDQWSVVSEPA